MDTKLLLVKSITLLYRESQIPDKTENSADLVRTVLDNITVSEVNLGLSSDKDIIIGMKQAILEMCDNPLDHQYEKLEILQQFKVLTSYDTSLYEAIKHGIEEDIPNNSLKITTINIRRSIQNHFKEQKIVETLSRAYNDFRYNRSKIGNINNYIGEIITQLDSVQINTATKDPAIISEVDIGNTDDLGAVYGEVQESVNGNRVFHTGWQGLNEMMHGGPRPGETWFFNGLKHGFKTGFNLSLFAQIPMFNKPLITPPGKKPLILRFSFEDKASKYLHFLYKYIKYDETREPVKLNNVSKEEMSEYVRDKLQVNGFHVKMLEVNPSDWTYKSLFNKIIELESQGYVVEVLFLDYMYKLPTTGCEDSTKGGDFVKMLTKIRNFCASKDIALINPHQFSTDAKTLLRSGIPDEEFVKEIAGKSYYEGSKSIDNVVDGAILFHIAKYQGKSYLTLQWEKHRFSEILEEYQKHMVLPFPKGMPIPSDLGRELSSFRSFKEAIRAGNAATDKEMFEM